MAQTEGWYTRRTDLSFGESDRHRKPEFDTTANTAELDPVANTRSNAREAATPAELAEPSTLYHEVEAEQSSRYT